MTQRALVILHPGFEEAEAVVPVDLLFRAAIKVITASTADELEVESRCGLKMTCEKRLDEVKDEDFDVVVLPGGPGIQDVRRNATICAILRRQFDAGRLIGCICAAPLLLLDAGLSKGRNLACHPSAEGELADAVERSKVVVVDGCIVTSRGAGTATEFGLALITKLKDSGTAKEIADAICWPHAIPDS